jgi:hypothetical protein
MNIFKETVFIAEIALQSEIALRAGEQLQATKDNSDKIGVWSSIQSILIAAGNVSKILWNQKFKIRAEELRRQLNVDENNILSNRRFRNKFEHYDEHIEEWFEDPPSEIHIDLAMNPSMLFGQNLNKVHRGYNSFNNTLILGGKSLQLDSVLNALKEIKQNCSPYLPPPLPPL